MKRGPFSIEFKRRRLQELPGVGLIATPLLKKACTLDPEHMAPAHLQLANLYLQRHDFGAARVQLQTFLQINPSAPQAPAIKKMLADIPHQQ